jgi:hypothetical protein
MFNNVCLFITIINVYLQVKFFSQPENIIFFLKITSFQTFVKRIFKEIGKTSLIPDTRDY